MSIIAWIIVGLAAGVIASKVINKAGEGLALDIVTGIGGAIAGGLLFHQYGTTEPTGFSPFSMLSAVVGAILALSVTRAIVGKGQAQT